MSYRNPTSASVGRVFNPSHARSKLRSHLDYERTPPNPPFLRLGKGGDAARRWILSTVLPAALCFVLPGCGTSDPYDSPAPPSAAPAQSAPAAQTPAAETASVDAPAAEPAGEGATSDADAAAGGDGKWGDLIGRFVYAGTPPEPKKVDVTKDVEYCSAHHPVYETLLVDPNGGLANVVIFIRPKSDEELDIHPDYEQTAEDKVVLDNLHCRFDPHVVLVRTGQPLVLRNSDAGVGHNTKIDPFKNPGFNQIIPNDNDQELTFSEAEGTAAPVSCNIHPWMTAYIIIRDEPYMTVSATDGTFKIEKLPVGEHEFQLWHESPGYLKDVSYAGGKASSRGRAKIKIAAGKNDLGDINVSPDIFRE